MSIAAILLAVFALIILCHPRLQRPCRRTQPHPRGLERHRHQLKRRHDLIPNLIETVKGYAWHETTTLEKVIQARNSAMAGAGGNAAERGGGENLLAGALKSVFALSEAYPDLKANANFQQLQQELDKTEDKLQASRRFYNSVVRTYNTKREMFPTSIFAGMFRFVRADFFTLDEAEKMAAKQVSSVKF